MHSEQVCREWHRQVHALRQQLALADLPPDGRLATFSHVTELQLTVSEQNIDPPTGSSRLWDTSRTEQLAALAHLRKFALAAQWQERYWRPAAQLVLSTLQRLRRLGERGRAWCLVLSKWTSVSLKRCFTLPAACATPTHLCDTCPPVRHDINVVMIAGITLERAVIACAEILEITGWCFRAGWTVELPQLQQLALTDCRFEPASWEPAAFKDPTVSLVALFGLQPAALQTLHVQCCVAVGAGFHISCSGLAAFSGLTSLSLAGSDFVCDPVAAEAGGLAALAHLDLSSPYVCDCSRRLPPSTRGSRGQLSPGFAAALLAGPPREGLRSSLRSLTLRGQAEVTDAAVAALSTLTALTRLDMALLPTGWDIELGDAGAQALGRGLTDLRVLRLGECRRAQRGCAALGRLTRLTGAPRSIVAVVPHNMQNTQSCFSAFVIACQLLHHQQVARHAGHSTPFASAPHVVLCLARC